MQIHPYLTHNQAVLLRDEFEELVELAQRSEPVEINAADDLPARDIMRLAEQGGSFDFWNEEGEDIYSLSDGEPV